MNKDFIVVFLRHKENTHGKISEVPWHGDLVHYQALVNFKHGLTFSRMIETIRTKVSRNLCSNWVLLIDPVRFRFIPDEHLDLLDCSLIVFTGAAFRPEDKARCEQRGLPYRDVMRCWDGGATFFTCSHGNKHWVDFMCDIRVEDDGSLISTDLLNLASPHIDHRTGDKVRWTRRERCGCGLPIDDIEFDEKATSIFLDNGSVVQYKELLEFSSKNGIPISQDVIQFVLKEDKSDIHIDAYCLNGEGSVDPHYLKMMFSQTIDTGGKQVSVAVDNSTMVDPGGNKAPLILKV